MGRLGLSPSHKEIGQMASLPCPPDRLEAPADCRTSYAFANPERELPMIVVPLVRQARPFRWALAHV